MVKQSRGFTVLEVILFLGVTGLLLLMIFIGTGGLARQTRFSDSVNSLQSFMQRQYDEVANGVNTSEGRIGCGSSVTVAGTRDCLLIGKIIHFRSDLSNLDLVKTSFVTSDPLPDTLVGATIYQQIANLNPREEPSDNYEINWGAQFASGSAGPANINSVAFIRSPESSRIFTYLYESGPPPTLRNVISTTPISKGAICINNPSDLVNDFAAIEFIEGEGAAGITTNFSPGALC